MDLYQQLLGRPNPLFETDLADHANAIRDAAQGRRLLVLCGTGSIGGAVVKKLFRYSSTALVGLLKQTPDMFGHDESHKYLEE